MLHNETVAPQLGEAPLGVSGVWETVGREGEKRVYAMRIGDRYTYREARISQSGVLIIVQGHSEKIGRPRARPFTGQIHSTDTVLSHVSASQAQAATMGAGFSSSHKAKLEAELAKRTAELAEMKARVDALEAEKAAKERASKVVIPDFVTIDLVPAGSQALFGSGLGTAAGYALRIVGKAAAFTVGASFIGLQTLSYLGYVQVDWRKVERDTTARLDRDGDGEFTANDLALVWREVESVLIFNCPAGTGFTAGLLYGIGMSATRAGGTAALAGLGARIILPRVLIGGATATAVPAAVVAAKHKYDHGAEHKPNPQPQHGAAAQGAPPPL